MTLLKKQRWRPGWWLRAFQQQQCLAAFQSEWLWVNGPTRGENSCDWCVTMFQSAGCQLIMAGVYDLMHMTTAELPFYSPWHTHKNWNYNAHVSENSKPSITNKTPDSRSYRTPGKHLCKTTSTKEDMACGGAFHLADLRGFDKNDEPFSVFCSDVR